MRRSKFDTTYDKETKAQEGGNKMADENVPSWLTMGADDNPGVTPMASTTPSQEPNSFSATTSSPPQESLEIDQGGADSRGTENSNAGRSMLKSSGAAKAKKAAPKKEVDESDLPQRLLVMRIANMLAVGALMAVSVSLVEILCTPKSFFMRFSF